VRTDYENNTNTDSERELEHQHQHQLQNKIANSNSNETDKGNNNEQECKIVLNKATKLGLKNVGSMEQLKTVESAYDLSALNCNEPTTNLLGEKLCNFYIKSPRVIDAINDPK